MAGIRNGVQALMRHDYPWADYFHCPNHMLNLAVSEAAEMPAMARALGFIKNVIDHFAQSPKRQAILEACIKNLDTETRKKKVKKFCNTRWVERFDALETFQVYLDRSGK